MDFRPPIHLFDFRTLLPRFQGSQDSVIEWLANAHLKSEERYPSGVPPHRLKKQVLRMGASTRKIHTRYSVLEDFTHTNWDRMRIFNFTTSAAGERSAERSKLYSDAVREVFDRFYAEESEPPLALIHVTCTGYCSPSGAQVLVARKNWGKSTAVVHAYHMGCYAALPALQMAGSRLLSQPIDGSRVDIVHTELCTLHMDPSRHEPEQIIAQSLFADGFVRYCASGLAPERSSSLLLLALEEEIIPDTLSEMEWVASDHGMRMTLSRDIPNRIHAALLPFLRRLLRGGPGTWPGPWNDALFAIHPGGPRIIETVQKALRLSDRQIEASAAILRDHGNMSSATLPHIWKRILDDNSVPAGTRVISLAFGPGLTLFGGVLKKWKPS